MDLSSHNGASYVSFIKVLFWVSWMCSFSIATTPSPSFIPTSHPSLSPSISFNPTISLFPSPLPSLLPSIAPTETFAPTTFESSCDDRLEYVVIAGTGANCAYYVSNGYCPGYFCDTCTYSYHYCSYSCGFCPNSTSYPTSVPSVSQIPSLSLPPTATPTLAPTPLPTISSMPSSPPSSKPSPSPSPLPSIIPTISSIPTFLPSLLPTAIPTITPFPTTFDSSCDDRLEYEVLATTGYSCAYYASLGDSICASYFCDTCAYPYHYCSETCGLCIDETLSPTMIPTISLVPTISSNPTSIPTIIPTSKPSITSRPSSLPTLIPSIVPSVTTAPTQSYYQVSNFIELEQAIDQVRDFVTIEITEDIIVNRTLVVSTNAYNSDISYRNLSLFSKTHHQLIGNNVPILYFWGISHLHIENLTLTKGVGNLEQSGGLTLHVAQHVVLRNMIFRLNSVGDTASNVNGALGVYNSHAVNLYNISFIKNDAYAGGAIGLANTDVNYIESDMHIYDCLFEDNEANLASDGTGAGGYGGAILLSSGATLSITRSTFNSNFAEFQALDIYILSGSLTGVDLVFSQKVDDSKAHIGRDDGSTLSCGPGCNAGEYGNCSLNILGLCYANCEEECYDCPAGTASDEKQVSGVESCSDCAPGFVSEAGATECEICEVGKYATNGTTVVNGLSLAGASLCANCQAGYYQPVEGGLRCLFCESGSSSNAGADDCIECGAGQYAQSGSSSCFDCDIGTYAASSGADSCTSCASFETSKAGATSCELALPGYYFPPSSSSVSECEAYSQCNGGDNLPRPNDGYWVERRSSEFAADLYRCSRSTCKGGAEKDIINGTSCWSILFFNKTWLASVTSDNDVCDSDTIQCHSGAYGPLCGACVDGYIYSASDSVCITCDEAWEGASIVISAAIGLLVFALLLFKYKDAVFRVIGRWWIVGIVRNLDDGALRVMWGTYQIIESVSWSLDVSFPYPYSKMLSGLSIFSFDFIPIDCLFKGSDHFTYVYIWSTGPLVLLLIIYVSYLIRIWDVNNEVIRSHVIRQHSYAALLLSFVVLPPVSRVQFQALDCETVANRSYLRVDTSVSCESNGFESFVLLDAIFIIVYLSMPLFWVYLLCRVRDHVNPTEKGRASVMRQNMDEDHSLQPLRFLYSVYKPQYYYFEAIEMFRRIFFVGLIPLLSSESSRRSSFGLFASLCSLAIYREVEPFQLASTNVLVHVAQIIIFLTYGSALVIDTGISSNVNKTLFGIILVVLNLVIVSLAIIMGALRHAREEREKWSWQHVMNTQEIDIVARLLPENVTFSSSTTRKTTVTEVDLSIHEDDDDETKQYKKEQRDARQNHILSQYLLKPKDVKLEKRIGAGAFGEVFQGKCLGEDVAVKTMIDITELNVISFKAEILLTATLRHPNIVNFVGACWGKELMCLVLEWVPKGSLASMLDNKSTDLMWTDPLLRLAMDLARGMAYLHGRSYYDEEEQKQQNCIIHRDLKPDNALVTEFSAAKLTDFGTSRAKDEDDITMTAVGTPLFCAPEIMRGELYDEKVDVYSFGMTLINMATDEPIIDFVAEKWRVSFNKKSKPKQPMRFIRAMTDDGWRPVTKEYGQGSIPQAPPSINSLIIRCCAQDAKLRPSFLDIINELSGKCSTEIQGKNYNRKEFDIHIDLIKLTSKDEDESTQLRAFNSGTVLDIVSNDVSIELTSSSDSTIISSSDQLLGKNSSSTSSSITGGGGGYEPHNQKEEATFGSDMDIELTSSCDQLAPKTSDRGSYL